MHAVLRKYYPGGFVGYDRDGRPVSIIPFGRCDLKGLLMSLGRVIETVTYIFDFDGFALSTLASKSVLDYVTTLMCTFEDNYPERLNKAIVINAPRYFPVFWRIIRPFLTERTANKVALYGKDEQAWRRALLESIEPDQLPQYWGGTRCDPDGNPRCPSLVTDGGEVPVRYYRATNGTANEQLSSAEIPSEIATLDVPVRVEQAGSLLAWEIASDDLLFGVSYRDANANDTLGGDSYDQVLLKPSRLKAAGGKAVETGSLTCDKPGIYVLNFDNTFSMFTSKKVTYSVRLVEPSSIQDTLLNPVKQRVSDALQGPTLARGLFYALYFFGTIAAW
ncbi:hypothetical protein HPB48_025549 [Haemaphysalis longicornis]|uniref:Uncharacterized protein n=1 Tax=Haemaphysalis longicornis TaxID=44386 RepID=A0A9J6H7Y8_HAELO|nr:hypothetical protein HPB48_025549 [Haemaphysalis longicornis]